MYDYALTDHQSHAEDILELALVTNVQCIYFSVLQCQHHSYAFVIRGRKSL